jgi:hypothetical protein
MKTFVILLFLCSSTLSFASHNSIDSRMKWCSFSKIKGLQEEILKLGRNDKFMHCSVSCQLGVHCGALASFNLGILKEAWDVVSPGDASYIDLRADFQGLKFYLDAQADTNQSCMDECAVIYPE